MARWEKVLQQMLNDQKPVGYTYDDAAGVLLGLGFEPPKKKKGGSHRKWTRKVEGTLVVIGLVESGSGPLRAYLIRDMLKTLRQHGLVSPRKDDV